MSSQHVSHLPTPLPGQSSTPPPLSTSLSSSNPLSPSSSHFNPNFGSAPTATARPKSASTLVPTNTVTTRDGITVRVRIDPALTVVDVVRQLCVSLKVPEPPTQFALRDDSDGLVTNENLRRAIAAKSALRLVRAPALEAADLVEKLQSREEKGLKLALFSLQKYIKEAQFANEFLLRNGLAELVSVIDTVQGNTLAYALSAMQHLLELDHGWDTLAAPFIHRVALVLAAPRSLVNVCRPATAILKRLVEMDAASAPGPLVASSSRGPPPPPPGSVYRYGFDVVFEQMRRAPALLDTVVARLGSGETALVLYSMMLINSLLAHATEAWWDEFVGELDRLNVRKAVVRLMSSLTIEDLTSSILDFQANMVRLCYRQKTTLVEPAAEPAQAATLDAVWRAARLAEAPDPAAAVDAEGASIVMLKWRRLGYDSEDLGREFGSVGLLGLHCLKHFVDADPEYFARVVLEQVSRPAERRCPLGKASNEVVELLAEHWAIYAGSAYAAATAFQPFFLAFYRVHALALGFFLRMWTESGASEGDFGRVSALVRSQVKVALRHENTRQWHEVEQDFISAEYRSVRDRQLRELEDEDDLLSKVPVRTLRAKLYSESSEFVRQQRLHCLLAGAWFAHAVPGPQSALGGGQGQSAALAAARARPWRFMRLDAGMRFLHYVDAERKFPVRPGMEDLPERIDVALIHEVSTGTGRAPANLLPGYAAAAAAAMSSSSVSFSMGSPMSGASTMKSLGGFSSGGSGTRSSSGGPAAGVGSTSSGGAGGADAASPLSFALLNTEHGALAELVAPDAARWADWTDGLNMLRREGGHGSSEETAAFVSALTEIGLKIRLLDLSGERVQIPSAMAAGQPPMNLDYHFSELNFDA